MFSSQTETFPLSFDSGVDLVAPCYCIDFFNTHIIILRSNSPTLPPSSLKCWSPKLVCSTTILQVPTVLEHQWDKTSCIGILGYPPPPIGPTRPQEIAGQINGLLTRQFTQVFQIPPHITPWQSQEVVFIHPLASHQQVFSANITVIMNQTQ